MCSFYTWLCNRQRWNRQILFLVFIIRQRLRDLVHREVQGLILIHMHKKTKQKPKKQRLNASVKRESVLLQLFFPHYTTWLKFKGESFNFSQLMMRNNIYWAIQSWVKEIKSSVSVTPLPPVCEELWGSSCSGDPSLFRGHWDELEQTECVSPHVSAACKCICLDLHTKFKWYTLLVSLQWPSFQRLSKTMNIKIDAEYIGRKYTFIKAQ